MALFKKEKFIAQDPWDAEREPAAWEQESEAEARLDRALENAPADDAGGGRLSCLLAAAVCCGMGWFSFRFEQAYGGLVEPLDWVFWIGIAISMAVLCFKKQEEEAKPEKRASAFVLLLLLAGTAAVAAGCLYFAPTHLDSWQLCGLCIFLVPELVSFPGKKKPRQNRFREAVSTLMMAAVSLGIIALWLAVMRPVSIQTAEISLQNAGCSRAVYSQSIKEDHHALLPLRDEPEGSYWLEESDRGMGYYIMDCRQNGVRCAAVVSLRSGRVIGMSDSAAALLWLR